jgi:hypothetical protein
MAQLVSAGALTSDTNVSAAFTRRRHLFSESIAMEHKDGAR